MSRVILTQVPMVRDDNDVPFVIGGPQSGRFSDVAGFEVRRGPSTCYFSAPVAEYRLNAMLQQANQAVFVMASAGPMLFEWWPIVTSGRPIPDCPLLTGLGAGDKLTLRLSGIDVSVSVMALPDPKVVVAACGTIGELDDEALTFAANVSLGMCRAALELLLEYTTMVRVLPDVDVPLGTGLVPLTTLVDIARQILPNLPGHVSA